MQSMVCEILADDAHPQSNVVRNSSSGWLGRFAQRIPGMQPRLLVASPAMMGMDVTTIAPELRSELIEQGFVVLRVTRYRKVVGFVVHRMNLAFRGGAINIREREVIAGAAAPIAFYLPLPTAGWSIYETPQTLTLRYSRCGFLTWSVGSDEACKSMHTALEQLNLVRPSQIVHAGSASVHSEQIAQRLSRPLIFGGLAKAPDFRLELFSNRGLAGVASDGVIATDQVWHGMIYRGRQFIFSGLGLSALVLGFAISLSVAVQTFHQQHPTAASQGSEQAPREVGSAYWGLSNLIGEEIRRAGITQIQSLRIAIEANKTSGQAIIAMTWSTLRNVTLRSVDEKSQSLVQSRLTETLAKLQGVALAEVDLASNKILVKLHPVKLSDGPKGQDLAKWIGELKKIHAVQLETKSATSSSLRLQAPDQPAGNLLAFLSSASRHPGLREILIRSTSPGLAAMEVELDLSP